MRRKRRSVLRAQPAMSRSDLETQFGKVWTVQDVAREFVITSIIGHTVVVRRKQDNAVGTLEYQEGPPCLYHSFMQQAAADPLGTTGGE